MKLGILQCDSVRPDLQPQFGDYPDMFRNLLCQAEPDTTFQIYDLTVGDFPTSLDACEGWLFTGSKWSVYDQEDWITQAHALAARLYEHGKPTVGICFGNQLMARALGGRVDKAPQGWGVGVRQAQILLQREWMDPWVSELALLVSHQDQVMTLPADAVRIAGHEFCPNDIVQIGEHVLTFQGHPEFSKGYTRALMEKRQETLGTATYQQGITSLTRNTDEARAERWIFRFLRRAAKVE
jgi:GMP synthase-like glutamine amidotransferase